MVIWHWRWFSVASVASLDVFVADYVTHTVYMTLMTLYCIVLYFVQVELDVHLFCSLYHLLKDFSVFLFVKSSYYQVVYSDVNSSDVTKCLNVLLLEDLTS